MDLARRIWHGLGLPGRREYVVSAFHRLYYQEAEQTWTNTRWLGVSAQKNPLDLWIYEELKAREGFVAPKDASAPESAFLA
jgi:cephalosporin hydroxylase